MPGAKPKLLLVAPYYFPQHYGGATQIYHALLSRLQYFEPIVLSDMHGNMDERIGEHDATSMERLGYRIERIPQLDFHFKSPFRPMQIIELLKFTRITLRNFKSAVDRIKPAVVVNGGTYNAGWLCNRAPGAHLRLNYIHGEELTQGLQYGPLARRLWNEQLKCIKNATLNVAVSRFTVENIQRLADVPSERILYFPNFIDTDRFHPPADRASLRQKLGWGNRPVILDIARLVRRKGVDNALKALASCDNLPDDWLFVIGGTGPEEGNLRGLVKELRLEAHVEFIGYVTHEDLAELYGAADIFLSPNRDVDGDTEGFGIVFLEANACGTVVIGGRDGGTADAIEDGVSGLRVDGADIGAIRLAILSLINDPARRTEMAEAGYARVIRDFDANRCVLKFEQTILEHIGQRA